MKVRKIDPPAIGRALELAHQYRLMNQPEEAESIITDVLEVDPNNQPAIEGMVLSLMDQDASPSRFRAAREYLMRIDDEYSRLFHAGIISEHYARSLLRKGARPSLVRRSFREAIEFYALAESIRPENADEAILRGNSCIRAMRRQG